MQPIVSIIIPLYNGEKYIIKCLESVRRQKCKNIEVVIVNDESKDNSVDLIEKYRAKYASQFEIKIVNQKNQGQGAARNTGIENAYGRYMMFIDQDDTLAEGILNKMLATAERDKADIVEAGYQRVTQDGKVTVTVRLKNTEWSKYKVVAPWSKLYRTDFINRNHARFLPVVLGEDIYFLMQLYSFRPKVDFLQDVGYNWLDNDKSLSNTAYKKIEEKTSLLQLYDMLEKLEHKDNLKNDRLYEYFLIKTAVWDILYTVRDNTFDVVNNNSRQIWNWFDEHFAGYKSNPYIKILKPEGETLSIRLVVWGYMLIKKLRLEKLFLKLFSKKNCK